jgi:hypothetical protein
MKISKHLKNKLDAYPHRFYDFSDGVEVCDSEIQKWLNKCAETLDKNNRFSFMGTGNTMVIAMLLGPDEETGKYEIVFHVSKNYEEFHVVDYDLDQVRKLNSPKHFFEIYKK